MFELPEVARVVEERLGTTRGSGRVDVIAGNVLTDELLYGYGAFLLANVVHCYTPEINRSILRRIRAHAHPGPACCSSTSDRSDARPAGRSSVHGRAFAIQVNDRDVYSVDEGPAWLTDTGWNFTGHSPLAGPISLVAAEAV